MTFGKKIIRVVLPGMLAVLFLPLSAAAQDVSAAPSEEPTEIVTEFDMNALEELTVEDDAMTIKPNSSFEAFSSMRDEPPEALNEEKLLHINRSLKRMIEENDKLRQQNRQLDTQLKEMRGQRQIEARRMNNIILERDTFRQENDRFLSLNQKYFTELNQTKAELEAREKALADQAVLAAQAAPPESAAASVQAKAAGAGGHDIVGMIDELYEAKQALRNDEAKVHYNMGNMHFKQRNYARAMKEYEAAVRLMPQDPNSHFNIAFVSSEFFRDYPRALKHYKQYLYLNPGAQDASLVREKIVEAELQMKSKIHSSLENVVDAEMNRVYQ